ncbi:twin-arginine translocation signal domain-containing protein [Halorussus sp. MSC15.2]|uniref:twin-arginine translocation signal domain-containing protein n=1 Tax=Halorussus sp. MSC15.2 TaxID=2283638 RepID=UPI0013D4C346|nr:twin-arginine translocation signal domain-containing protein [Halorussus sp. MSC15.2]NEU57584.1 twin-arginine translocation signal domain-containing protein [Halorussus sp. MSC15.2]
MSEESDKGSALTTNRREFLKRATVSGALGVTGITSSATIVAGNEGPKTDEKPRQQEAKGVFTTYADDLLSLLASEGILDNGTITELPLDEPVDYETVASKSGEGVNFATWSGVRADEYRIVKQLDDGVLSVAVQPAKNHAYAFYEPDTTEETYLIKSDVGVTNVEREACYKDCGCVSQCGNSVWADRRCCIQEPCGSSCAWNVWCDCCNGC